MLEGDADGKIFGSDRVQSVYAVNVMGIDSSNNSRILINAGQVHGIRKGTKFAVYPLGFTDFSGPKKTSCHSRSSRKRINQLLGSGNHRL